MLEKRSGTKKTQLRGIKVEPNYPNGKDVEKNPAYGIERPEFGAPLQQRATTNPETNHDAEHVLEFQLLKWLFLDPDRDLPSVPHPDPSRTGTPGFCQLMAEQWRDVPEFATAGLDTGKGYEAKLKPADHVAQQFPTASYQTDEYVALEKEINVDK